MKNLIILILVGTLVWLSSCGESPPSQTMAIAVLIDKTDKLELPPEKDKIFGLMLLNPKSMTEVQTGVQIRVSEISSVDFNMAQDISIPSVNYKKTNIKARQKEIKIFYQKLDKAFEENTKSKEYQNSSIYLPIAREAIRLSKLSTDTKTLIIYSDLMEYSDWLNAYKEYRVSDDILVKKFQEQIPLRDLTGLRIILRYIPRDAEDNIRYRKLVSVYTKVFESKGATLSFEF